MVDKLLELYEKIVGDFAMIKSINYIVRTYSN